MSKSSFEQHGIDHLSASSLNTWLGEPALWVMERLLKKGAPVGAAAHRGSAIEHGIELALFHPDKPLEECQAAAIKDYDLSTAMSGDPNREKERAVIADSVKMGAEELRQYGIPTVPAIGRQHKISVTLPDVPVPIIGYIDFTWDQHGVLIDLKTEHRLSSQIRSAHARQVALYVKAKGNHEGRVAYVTPKKVGVYRLEPEDVAAGLATLRQVALRLERFLNISTDPHELAGLLCPDPDSFYFNSQLATANRVAVYGY